MVNGLLGGIAGGATVAITIKAIDNYSKEFNKVGNSMEKFTSIAKGAAIAGAAAFAAFTASAVQAGLRMKPIEDSFRKLAKASDMFLFELNLATKGTITDFELMANANKALLLGLDQEALPDLFRNAAIVGRAAGRSTTEAIEDITLGIGRQSRMILDNLGIIIKADDVYKNYAESIGKATEQLTAQEKQTAFNSAAMLALQESADKLGGIIPEDAITDIQRLTKGFEDFKTAFGTAFIENFSVAMPKAEKDFSNFGKTAGQVVGSISAAVVLTGRMLELVIRSVVLTVTVLLDQIATGMEKFVNMTISGINAIIKGLNSIKGFIGLDKIDLVTKVDFSSGLSRSVDRQVEQTERLVDKMTQLGQEMNDSFKNVGKTQGENLVSIENQVAAVKQLTKEQELLDKLAGFKVISQTGDIFDPKAFSRSQFESKFGFEQAKRGGGVSIVVEGDLIGLDPEEISRALSNELGAKLSL